MVQHVSLSAAGDIHVCKGADTATAGKVVVANGAGGQSFLTSNAHGGCYFVNYATPYTLVYPSSYTKLNPVTTAVGIGFDFTEGLNARLTYTGTIPCKARIFANLSLDQSVGANRDIGIIIAVNGNAVAGSEIFTTAPSGLKQLVSSFYDVSLTTNDYVEAFVINLGGSGDIKVYSYVLSALAVRG